MPRQGKGSNSLISSRDAFRRDLADAEREGFEFVAERAREEIRSSTCTASIPYDRVRVPRAHVDSLIRQCALASNYCHQYRAGHPRASNRLRRHESCGLGDLYERRAASSSGVEQR